MNIWLIKDGEHLPTQTSARPMRMGMLANQLLQQGHHVTWWASTFSHQRKALFFSQDKSIEINEQFRLNLIHAGSYQKNISFARLRHHQRLARKLGWSFYHAQQLPDLIVCAFPIIEVAHQAVYFANKNNIPIVIDIRDIWPDLYLQKLPSALQGVGKIFFQPAFERTKEIFKQADGLIAISQGILNWALQYAGRQVRETDKVIYHGYPPLKNSAYYDLPFAKELQGKIVFVYTGTFSSAYDMNLICQVAERLQTNPKIHFVLAGKGESFANIKTQADKLNNVTMPGWLEQPALSALLTQAHVGLLPWHCIKDAMPNKIFEYLAAGLPILSSAEGDPAQLIANEKVGFSYAPGEPGALENLIVKLTEDTSLCQQLTTNAQQAFAKQYNQTIIFNDYANHLEQLCNINS